MSLERTHIDFTVVAAAVTVVESSLEVGSTVGTAEFDIL